MGQTLAKRTPNWLPVPHLLGGRAQGFVEEAVIDPNDLFPKGQIVKYFQDQDYGFIKDQRGHDVYFNVNEMDLLGPRGKKENLKAGLKVGYDVSQTSKGLHVRRMKVY